MPSDKLFDKYSRKSMSPRAGGSVEKQNVLATVAKNSNVKDVQASENMTIQRVNSGLAKYTGAWTTKEVIHLLRRVNFGNSKKAIELLLGKSSASEAIDYMLNLYGYLAPAKPTPTPVNFYESLNNASDRTTPYGEDWTQLTLSHPQGSTDSIINNHRTFGLQFWTWGVWLNDDTYKAREKMANFWYHFIPIEFDEIRFGGTQNSGIICHDYMKLLRDQCLGNFRVLIEAISKSTAMLYYLGNHSSTASAPNENFARELMELFTIGKEPQNYTEQDVQAAAKVLSGWRNVKDLKLPYPLETGFQSSRHNQEHKAFSSFFGNTTILNKTGAAGAQEFNEFFDMLFQYQGEAIAKYICRRLYRFFVYYNIDQTIETNIIEPLASQLLNGNWEIKPIVEKLFKSEHFFDMANRGVIIKSPFDLVAGTLNTFNVNTAPADGDVFKQYKIWEYFQNQGRYHLEQTLGNVPTVAGWKAYYQAPSYAQNWINSSTIQKRDTFIVDLINGSKGVSGIRFKIDTIAFVKQFDLTIQQNPETLVDLFILYSLPQDLPQEYKQEIKEQTLLNNQTSDHYWTNAWNAYLSNPNTANTKIVEGRLKALADSILRLAEFQLM